MLQTDEILLKTSYVGYLEFYEGQYTTQNIKIEFISPLIMLFHPEYES